VTDGGTVTLPNLDQLPCWEVVEFHVSMYYICSNDAPCNHPSRTRLIVSLSHAGCGLFSHGGVRENRVIQCQLVEIFDVFCGRWGWGDKVT
jgi:hypothetical protein